MIFQSDGQKTNVHREADDCDSLIWYDMSSSSWGGICIGLRSLKPWAPCLFLEEQMLASSSSIHPAKSSSPHGVTSCQQLAFSHFVAELQLPAHLFPLSSFSSSSHGMLGFTHAFTENCLQTFGRDLEYGVDQCSRTWLRRALSRHYMSVGEYTNPCSQKSWNSFQWCNNKRKSCYLWLFRHKYELECVTNSVLKSQGFCSLFNK